MARPKPSPTTAATSADAAVASASSHGAPVLRVEVQRARAEGRARKAPNGSDMKDRILAHVEQVTESGCWIWIGAWDSANGYGKIRTGSRKDGTQKNKWVHRAMYEAAVGPIPDGLVVCHRCDVGLCVRPDHLFLGTTADNNKDARQKGRHRPGNKFHAMTHSEQRRIRNLRRAGMRLRLVANLMRCHPMTIIRTVRKEDKEPRLWVRCGWCSKTMAEGDPGAETTTGICRDCDDKFRAENGLSLKTAWGEDK